MNAMHSTTLAESTLSLVSAERNLARARQRLYALQRAAVFGHQDAAALDGAVLAYRRARSEAAAVRAAWRRTYGGDADAAPLPRAEEPSGHVRFARWLVEASGRPETRAA
ncbi:MAG TPA: hypothetical protein VHS99_13165 [Chloroflexota bacterium]|nr:hypothetical protein [Chloroflexota bacterium]